MPTEPRLNANPRNQVGPLINRPIVGTRDGQLYTSQFGVSGWDEGAGLWRGTGGVVSMPGFWVAPTGSPYDAPFNTPQAAITAADATGNQEAVLILPGSYNGDIALPSSRVSLVGIGGGVGGMSPSVSTDSQAVIVGNVHIAALSGTMSIENLSIHGTLSENGGGVASTLVGQLRRVNIFAPLPSPPNPTARAISLVNSGQTWLFDEVTADTANAGGIGSGDHALSSGGATNIVAKRSRFSAEATFASMSLNGGTLVSNDVEYDGLIMLGAATVLDMTDTLIHLGIGATATLISGFAGSAIKFHGYIRNIGLDAAGTISDVAGVVSGDPGVNFGSLQVAKLPVNPGVGTTAFCSDLAGQIAEVYSDGVSWRRFSNNTVAN